MFSCPRLFSGLSKDHEFSVVLKRAISLFKNGPDAQMFGDVADYDTHSLRKGMITYLYSMMNGPTGLQIKQRAGHTLGKINDAYVLSRGQGDPFCGRCLRFASLHSEEFARLPPHFRPLGPGETDKLDMTNLFSDIFCENSDYTVNFKRLVPYLYARIVYSWDNIRAKLPHNHILYSHKAIQALLDESRLRDIRARLVGLNDENKFFECKCGCGMTASGVPALTTQFTK